MSGSPCQRDEYDPVLIFILQTHLSTIPQIRTLPGWNYEQLAPLCPSFFMPLQMVFCKMPFLSSLSPHSNLLKTSTHLSSRNPSISFSLKHQNDLPPSKVNFAILWSTVNKHALVIFHVSSKMPGAGDTVVNKTKHCPCRAQLSGEETQVISTKCVQCCVEVH